MIIGIDGNEANIVERVGVNKYAFEILWGLYKLNQNSANPDRLIVYLKNKPLNDLPKENKYFEYKVLPGRGVWVLTKLTPHILKNREKLDVFFSPSHYTLPLALIPRVCSIMDLGYLEFSGQFRKMVLWQLKCWSAISIFVSKQILTISESTKKDIVRHYPFASKKITTTLLGYDFNIYNTSISTNLVRQVKNRYSIVSDYILYLGTLKPSKNLINLVEAYSLFLQKNGSQTNIQLVIAGKKGWMYEEVFEKVRKLNLESKVIFTDFVKEEEKPALIFGAKAFVLPSFWEGFGLDIVSAMACGVPVIVSKAGSIPEVAGDAGIYIDPNSPSDIQSKLSEVIFADKIKYNKLRAAGLNQAKKFSWAEAARITLTTLKNVGNKRQTGK